MVSPRVGQEKALDLIDEGIVSADQMVSMALKYMSNQDILDMLEHNELVDLVWVSCDWEYVDRC